MALIRGLRRIAGDHLDLGERQIELLGGDLRERRRDTLAELDFAGKDYRRPVGIDAQPGVEHAVVGQASRQLWRLGAGEARGESEGEDQRTRRLAELSPGQ